MELVMFVLVLVLGVTLGSAVMTAAQRRDDRSSPMRHDRGDPER